MEWGLLFQAISIAVAVLGIVIAGFWRIWGLIKEVRAEAALRSEAAAALASTTRQELHAHQLHVAQEYVSKAGLREVTDQIMGAIEGIGAQMTGMNGRIDRILERPAPRPTAARS